MVETRITSKFDVFVEFDHVNVTLCWLIDEFDHVNVTLCWLIDEFDHVNVTLCWLIDDFEERKAIGKQKLVSDRHEHKGADHYSCPSSLSTNEAPWKLYGHSEQW